MKNGMYKNFCKRIIDFTLALIGLIVISPVFVIVCIWLIFDNEGAGAFFFQERPGRNEKVFKVIKFKSMNDKKDSDGNLLPDKDRLTRAGAFVRKTSLDEIPQLINVLKGDMSLVGPRPLLVEYLPYYSEREKKRHSVRPGITGLAQVNGRNNLTWDKRLEMDAEYVESISFINDVKIIFNTIVKVLRKEDIVVALDPKVNIPLHIYRRDGK